MTTFSPEPLPCTPDQTRCWRTHCFPLLLVFIILTIIYANSFKGAWIFDDIHNIVDNPHVHLKILDWESVTGTFVGVQGRMIDRPLSFLSFGLNHFVHGLDTWGYHLVNFTIHCLAALFLYLFIFQTLHLPRLRDTYAERAGSIAMLATMLWATHPIHVTAVTVIVQRMASMAAMFFIMAMFFYLMGRISPGLHRKVGWFFLCALSGLLSLASKENAVMLPVVLYVYDLLLIQGVDRQKLKRHLLYGAIPLLFLVVMAFVMANPIAYLTGSGYEHRDFTLMERLLTQPRVLLFYLSLMLYPMTDRFTLVYEVQLSTSLFSLWTTLPAIVFWIAWAGAGICLAKRYPLIAFCLLFFMINHLIESSFIPLELIYEHRNYLPSMTLFLLAGMGILKFYHDFCGKTLLKALVLAFVFITIAGQGYSVIQRNALYDYPFFVWHDNAMKSPGLSRVHINLGKAYDTLGFHEQARVSYQEAIDVNRFHRSELRAVPLVNLGIYFLENDQPDEAAKRFEEALEHAPDMWEAQWGMASALLAVGDYDAARDIIERMLTVQQRHAGFLGMHSLLLFHQGDYHAAIIAAHKSLQSGGDPVVQHIIGQSHALLGDYDMALKYWRKYLETDPQDIEAHLALLHLASKLGNSQDILRLSINLLGLKRDQTWSKLFQRLDEKQNKGTLVFSMDPKELLPVIKKGLRQVSSDLEEEMVGR